MSGPEPQVRTGSLRRRVTTSTIVLLVIVLLATGFTVHSLLADQLRDDLHARLQDRATYAALLYRQNVTGQDLADQTTGDGVDAVVLSRDQTYLGRTTSELPGTRPGPGGGPRPPGEQQAQLPQVVFSESDGWLIASFTLGDNQIRLSADERQIDYTLAELRTIELAAGAVVVVVAGLLLWFVVGGSLRPLTTMTNVARSIRDGARGRRLRPTKPRTELGRTATAFDEMLDAVEHSEYRATRAEEQMRQFLADASHDLRTPLAGVIAGSERLLLDGLDRQEREDRTVAVIRQARRASRLVDDILVMTRLESDTARGNAWATVDLGELTEQEVAAARLRAPQMSLTVSGFGVPVMVDGDADGLRRAVTNLLDNALRHARSEVRASVSVADGRARLTICDDGPGIPVADRARIFERFVRLDAARSSDGSGLGLPIAATIVGWHGGDVAVHDAPHGGACFAVTLPLSASAGAGYSGAVSTSFNASSTEASSIVLGTGAGTPSAT